MTSVDDWELWLRDVATDADPTDEPRMPSAGSRAVDDPWAALDIAATPLSADQRVFLLDPATLLAELGPSGAPAELLPSSLDPDAFTAVVHVEDHPDDE